MDPAGTSLKTLVIGAEPHTDEQRRKIERMLGVKAYNSFGMTEMNGPGVAFECTEQDGMHFWEDCYLVEIINPETGEPVPEGEIGELVLTTLDREMMPLIRYRTRDLTRILPGKCPCGRTHIRIDRIKGHHQGSQYLPHAGGKGAGTIPRIGQQLPHHARNGQ